MAISNEDIAQYLRDNLTIEIKGEQKHAMMGDGTWYEVEVKLLLGPYEFSTSSTTIDIVE